jgi:predicted acylesterase/phospholipase RssA
MPSEAASPVHAQVGLALAGGGPEGAVWEVGALRAIDEALDGLDLNALGVYVGVSAGSFLAACLANGMTTGQLCRAMVKQQSDEHPIAPRMLFTPAVRNWMLRGLQLPRVAFEAVRGYLENPEDQGLFESFTRLSRAMPVGLFDNEPIRRYLERIFALKGRTDDFRRLSRKLRLVATDLDAARAVCFGAPGHDHVPISRAVQASSALPGLYPPVSIDGRFYVDGVLLKTLHASVALEEGARLLLCVNPIVPVDTTRAVEAGAMRRGRLIFRGLPTVLSQTFRTLVHSRLVVGMRSYDQGYPDADVILVEPGYDDYRMFFTNIFSFASRRDVCEHAYLSVRRQLLARAGELQPQLARHGLSLNLEVLRDESRTVWTDVGYPQPPPPPHPTERGKTPIAQELNATLSRLEALLGPTPPEP